MLQNELILIGGGGHCVSCIDVIESQDHFKIVGVVDVAKKVGQEVQGYQVVGTDEELEKFVRTGKFFVVTIGHVGKINRRIAVFEKLEHLSARVAVVQSPLAYVSRKAVLG
ncbi:MAG: acetyltransferase, partial [Candidatus Omnitrophica bacterium]|nr:acetyltransferase [Candidatus Omnitrophota bacterium]